MQQAAQRLLQGQSVVYDYSFVNKLTEDDLKSDTFELFTF